MIIRAEIQAKTDDLGAGIEYNKKSKETDEVKTSMSAEFSKRVI